MADVCRSGLRVDVGGRGGLGRVGRRAQFGRGLVLDVDLRTGGLGVAGRNTSTTPSSGFFNSGAGGASGFLNDAGGAVSGLEDKFADSSGLFNSGGPGISGLQNVGTLQSGWANLGNFMSGVYNTSILNLATQAFVSGFANFGTRLSGVLNSGTGP
jgi:hypothetical protein